MADNKAINAIKAHASCDHERALLIEHTEGLNVNEESAKQYIRMALNVLRAMDTARRVL